MDQPLSAADLAPLVNAYQINPGLPRTIVVPQAKRLAEMQSVTVTGTLLRKQLVQLDPTTNERRARLAAHHGAYVKQEADGDLHFCLGPGQLQPHIACELQNAAQWLSTFNSAVEQDISVSGFFRCLFEHPGFNRNDDAHIFEIHPVRAVDIGGSLLPFDVDIPDQTAIHTWIAPHNLNVQDGQISVQYDEASDQLTFTDMTGKDENYVVVSGSAGNVQLSTDGSTPSQFTLSSPDIQNPVQVYCLIGTSAAWQLGQLSPVQMSNITMVGLRNIDLTQALQNHYVINLLAIDIQGG